MNEKMFPVLDAEKYPGCPREIPWRWLEPVGIWAQRNHGGQTLERLAQRGGLSPLELMCVVDRRPLALYTTPPEAARNLAAWLGRQEELDKIKNRA